MRSFFFCLSVLLLAVLDSSLAQAQTTSPQTGWQTHFSEMFHNVSGTVSVVDDDTLRFDDFTYDGGGLSVFFYLAAEDSRQGFIDGLSIGNQLVHTVFDGTQSAFLVDLPAGESIADYHAISVWCVTAGANFGSGSFAAVDASAVDFDVDGDVDGADFLDWQRGEAISPPSPIDLINWQANFGTTATLSAALGSVPEPSSVIMLLVTLGTGLMDRNLGGEFR